jgi:hypothetical protein
MSDKQTTIIEVNGIKLEVDLLSAKRIDELKVGSRVKCLVKTYDAWTTYPGIVVGFEPFPSRPTIVVAYLDTGYGSTGLKFKSFNSDTKDFEIVSDLDHNALEIDRESVIANFDRDLMKKEVEMREIQDRKAFFLSHFGRYFTDAPVAA